MCTDCKQRGRDKRTHCTKPCPNCVKGSKYYPMQSLKYAYHAGIDKYTYWLDPYSPSTVDIVRDIENLPGGYSIGDRVYCTNGRQGKTPPYALVTVGMRGTISGPHKDPNKLGVQWDGLYAKRGWGMLLTS